MPQSESPSVSLAFRFHVNLYHSYRGDSLDERGIGKDLRIIRGILDDLDRLNREGVPVRGCWDIENYYSLELYLPRHAPDIIARIRDRVSAGTDEVELMSYNNGLIPAQDRQETERAIAWAISNPAGSGIADVFSAWAPIVRPQECMFTPSNIEDYRRLGVEALSIYYSAIPFNGFGSFVPPLPFTARFNPLTLVSDKGQRLALLPAYNHGDIVEHGLSLRRWLRALRRRQLGLAEARDILLLIDMDADDTFWEGFRRPGLARFFPSFGGLYRLATSVADLPYLRFVRPWDYLCSHPRAGELHFGQDCADGSYDGFSSWAEKRENVELWTAFDRARRIADAAGRHGALFGTGDDREAARRFGEKLEGALSARLLALSTTHFGMASPAMNVDRLRDAYRRVGTAREAAEDALAAAVGIGGGPGPLRFLDSEIAQLALGRGSLMTLEEGDRGGDLHGTFSGDGPDRVRILANPSGTLLAPEEALRFSGGVRIEAAGTRIGNEFLRLEARGADCVLLFADDRPALAEALSPPRIVYDGKVLSPGPTRLLEVAVTAEGRGARLATGGEIRFPDGEVAPWRRVHFLFEGLPYLYIDMGIDYPETERRKYDAAKAERLGRSWDGRWKETAPCELVPALPATAERPVRIWKHNFEDAVSHYDLDYHRYGPNRRLSAVNNHVTDAWLALAAGGRGLLIAQSAAAETSFAFCPLRSRIEGRRQIVAMNPFGTYGGPQLRYPTRGNGLGRRLAVATGEQYDSYAPSWAGGSLRFSLMLAPYEGDCPPPGLQRDALLFATPPMPVRGISHNV